MPRPVITLLTDFGGRDLYVGVMKGVIAGICPDANIIDITHDVPPQDIETGAFFLAHAFSHFPLGTIHVAVVDPGVGTSRRPIAVAAGGHRFIGPDNGLLALAINRAVAIGLSVEEVRLLDEPRYFRPNVSSTFHGRDIFAPVAAHLASGLPLEALGPLIADRVQLAIPTPRRDGDQVEGQVVLVDRFGNLVTNLTAAHVDPREEALVEIEGIAIGRVNRAYGDVEPKSMLALFGSFDLLEIAMRDGSASKSLDLGRGARVTVRRGM